MSTTDIKNRQSSSVSDILFYQNGRYVCLDEKTLSPNRRKSNNFNSNTSHSFNHEKVKKNRPEIMCR